MGAIAPAQRVIRSAAGRGASRSVEEVVFDHCVGRARSAVRIYAAAPNRALNVNRDRVAVAEQVVLQRHRVSRLELDALCVVTIYAGRPVLEGVVLKIEMRGPL